MNSALTPSTPPAPPLPGPLELAPATGARSVFVAETFGTFCLVFAGTGAAIIDGVSGGQISHVGVALVFGLVVTAMIYALGNVSGAHLNPAVTLGFAFAGRLPWPQLAVYVPAQLLGAFAASGTLRILFGNVHHLGATLPAGPPLQSLVLEVVLTMILMTVILCVAIGHRESGIIAGGAIGAVVGLEAMFAGPICGASMNPARSLAPALVTGDLTALWVYFVGPVLGAVLAVLIFSQLRKPA